MKNVILISVLAGAAAGGGGAVLTQTLGGSTSTDQVDAIDPDEVTVDELTEEIGWLRNRNADLEARVDDLESRSKLMSPGRVAVSEMSDEERAFQDDLKTVAAAIREAGVVSKQNLRQNVAAELDAIREAEDAERDRQREEREEERMKERIAELTEKLGLDPNQSTQLGKVMRDEAAKRDAMFAEMRENGGFGGGDRGGMREAWGALREETQLALTGFLSPDQIEKYNESNRGGRGGFGGGDRGGGGGRGGRGN